MFKNKHYSSIQNLVFTSATTNNAKVNFWSEDKLQQFQRQRAEKFGATITFNEFNLIKRAKKPQQKLQISSMKRR
jgi:hypothetical protein